MDNQLQVIVEGSGLEKTKAQFILDKFTNYFEIAADWENKAKTIVVSSEQVYECDGNISLIPLDFEPENTKIPEL